ncbi:two-component system sensor kinase protein [Corynebacterium ulcerans BR-AD22]|nr:two-component system sensor kinase protein [Corynebacterium ulcerans BR-AD22]
MSQSKIKVVHSSARKSVPTGPAVSTYDVAKLALPFMKFLVLVGMLMILAIVRWDTPRLMITQLSALAIFVATWVWWSFAVTKHSSLPAPTWAFAGSTLAIFLTANDSSSLVVMWLAVVVVVICQSLRAGIIYGLIPVILVTVIHIVSNSSPGKVITETLASLSFIAIGIFLARLTHTAATNAVEKALKADELAKANSHLRKALDTTRELTLSEERGRIAAALHDGLGHRLTAISMSLEFAQRMIDKQPERAIKEITQARNTTIAALDDMRTVVRALHPIRLESEHFFDALNALGQSFTSTVLKVKVSTSEKTDADLALPTNIENFLLAATQEALTNVVRHSVRTTTAHLTVRHQNDSGRIILSVSDNGEGCNEFQAGFGVRSLQERAEALSGRIEVEGHGGIEGGFLLKIELPIPHNQ